VLDGLSAVGPGGVSLRVELPQRETFAAPGVYVLDQR